MWSNYYYFLLLRVTNIVVKAPQNWMVLGVYGRHPFHLYFVLCGILQEFLLSSQCHFYYILLLTVTNIVVKSSTELDGDRCIWKASLSTFFCVMWHDPRILIELTESLLLYLIIDSDQHSGKSSTELDDDRCIWKAHISPFFCPLWHAPRILIELKESLLLYVIIFYYRHWPT